MLYVVVFQNQILLRLIASCDPDQAMEKQRVFHRMTWLLCSYHLGTGWGGGSRKLLLLALHPGFGDSPRAHCERRKDSSSAPPSWPCPPSSLNRLLFPASHLQKALTSSFIPSWYRFNVCLLPGQLAFPKGAKGRGQYLNHRTPDRALAGTAALHRSAGHRWQL